MSTQDLVYRIQRALRLTEREAERLCSNLWLYRISDVELTVPPEADTTARIPVGVGDEMCVIKLDDLGELAYEIQRAMAGDYL